MEEEKETGGSQLSPNDFGAIPKSELVLHLRRLLRLTGIIPPRSDYERGIDDGREQIICYLAEHLDITLEAPDVQPTE